MKHYFVSIFKDSKRQSLYASFPRWYKERGVEMLPRLIQQPKALSSIERREDGRVTLFSFVHPKKA